MNNIITVFSQRKVQNGIKKHKIWLLLKPQFLQKTITTPKRVQTYERASLNHGAKTLRVNPFVKYIGIKWRQTPIVTTMKKHLLNVSTARQHIRILQVVRSVGWVGGCLAGWMIFTQIPGYKFKESHTQSSRGIFGRNEHFIRQIFILLQENAVSNWFLKLQRSGKKAVADLHVYSRLRRPNDKGKSDK